MYKKVIILICSLCLCSGMIQAAAPADNMIKGVVDDLNRYESQASGLTSGDKRGINNIKRFLPVTEARLASSSHQSDPSWVEANDRLQALKQRLDDLIAGKATAAASSTSSPSSAGMSDQQLSQKYQKDYNALSNELRRTHASKFADATVVSGYKTRLAELEGVANSFQDSRNKAQFQSNYKSFAQWFDQTVANAQKQAGVHQQKADARASAEQERTQRQADAAAAVAKADADRNADFQAREQARKQRIADRNTANAAIAENYDKQIASSAEQFTDADTHNQFGRAYQDVRVSLQFLSASELNDPKEGAYWKRKLGEFESIVAKFKDQNNPDVKKDLETYAAMKTKLDGLFGASEKTDLTNYPDYAKDVEQLKTLDKKYRFTRVFVRGKEERAKSLYLDYDSDRKLHTSLLAKYGPFMKGVTNANHASLKESKELKRWFRTSGENLDAFASSKRDFFAEVFPEMDKYFNEIDAMLDRAEKSQNMSGFGRHGIPDRLAKAESNLIVYQAVMGNGDPKVVSYSKKLNDMRHKVSSTEASLAKLIVASREMPKDLYQHEDRDEMLKITEETFKKTFPDKPVLASGIYDAEWDRQTSWEVTTNGGALYKRDVSEIYVWVVVKKSNELATIYSSNLFKNHMKGDLITSYGYDKNKPGRDMLMDNVKR